MEENKNLEQQTNNEEKNNKDSKLGIGIALAATGIGIGLICSGVFEADRESEVCYYGPAPVIEEQTGSEEETVPEIQFDPKMEEMMCDYGVPTTFWNK